MEHHRKQYSPEFKLKVVLESLPRETTLEAVRQKFGVSNSMIHRGLQEFQARAAEVFVDKRNPRQKAHAQGYAPGESPDALKHLIGELTVQKILKKPGCLQTARTRMKMAYTPGQRGSGHKPP
jgi:transposase